MELRNYQKDAIAKTYDSLKAHRATILQLPTGAGKTVVLGRIVQAGDRNRKRVLVAAHRHELLSQIQGTLTRFGLMSGRIQSGHSAAYDYPLQVASVASLVRRTEAIAPPDLIIFDECHHATAKTYLQIIERFPQAKVLGVTATPTRMDGKPLSELFTDLIQVVSVADLVEQGWLVPPVYYSKPSVIGDGSPRIQRGDYSSADLSRMVQEVDLNGDLVREWLDLAGGVSTVVFAVNCEHSRRIVLEYQAQNIPAAHIDGKCPKNERERILGDFAAGRIKILSNVNIVTEGFDLPEIGCVQLARPTQSVAMNFQMIGRALRPSPGKEKAIILDHAGIYEEHGSVIDPVFWSLETEMQSKRAQQERQERQDKESEPTELVVFGTEDRLVRIDPNAFPRPALAYLIKLREKAIATDKKKIWIAYEMRREFPDLDRAAWQIVAKSLGYHHKWVSHWMENQND